MHFVIAPEDPRRRWNPSRAYSRLVYGPDAFRPAAHQHVQLVELSTVSTTLVVLHGGVQPVRSDDVPVMPGALTMAALAGKSAT